MQRLRKCLGIDIGTTSIKIAEVVAEKTGPRITQIVRAELNLPPGPMDTERVAAIAKVVRDAVKEAKITTKQAVFCVAGQSVFIRRIRVPRTTDERLHRIVAYEARQQIPFALDNSLMEYQVFDWGDSGEVEVLLVAIKKDIVLDFMKIVNKTGLKAIAISVSSLALFNFHVFDSTPFDELVEQLSPSKKKSPKKITATPDATESEAVAPAKKKGFSFSMPSFGKKKAAPEPVALALEDLPEAEPADFAVPEESYDDIYEEVRAYVNIGAQTFDLAIARLGKRKMLGFTRSVPWAGNELTRALVDKLGLASVAEAEEVKRTRAIVIVPGREEEVTSSGADPDASEFTTSWADRLILDLRKSFDYYISQPDGMAVDNILLSGGQARQSNLASYIEDKLGIPVDFKNQFDNAALKVDNPPEEMSSFLVAVGLGLTGIGLGQVSVDFLPPELKTIREFKKKNVEIALLAFAIIGMLVVSTQVGTRNIENMQRFLDDKRPAIDTAQQTNARIQEARNGITAVSAKYTALSDGINDRDFWLEFLGMIEGIKPPELLITSIQMKPDGTVTMECEAVLTGPISNFADALKQQKEWIESVNLSSPVTSFSQFIGQEINRFRIDLKVHWKKTRLDPARGPWKAATPTPVPLQQQTPPPGVPGDPSMGGVI